MFILSKMKMPKKLLSLLLTLLIFSSVFSCLGGMSVFALTTEEYDFSDKTAGQGLSFPWITKGTVAAAADPLDSSNIAIKVSDATNRSSSSATLLFDRTYEETTVSFDMLVPTACEWSFGLFPDNSQDFLQISMTGDDKGQFSVYNYSQTVNLGSYPVNEWFNLKFVIDPSKKVFSVALNNTTLIENAQFKREGLDFDYFAGIFFRSSFITSAEFYFDKVDAPKLNQTAISKYEPIEKSVSTIQAAASDDTQPYKSNPTAMMLNDGNLLTVYRKSTGASPAVSAIEASIFDTATNQTISTTKLYEATYINATNPEIVKMPNGNLYIFINKQTYKSSATDQESNSIVSIDNGYTWSVLDNGIIDTNGVEYSTVYSSFTVGNDVYMVANADNDTNPVAQTEILGVHVIKSSDNGQSWTDLKNLSNSLNCSISDCELLAVNEGYILVANENNFSTRIFKLDGSFDVIAERNLTLDFNCVGIMTDPTVFEKDGSLYLLGCNREVNIAADKSVSLYQLDATTLAPINHTELDPVNSTNQIGGFYFGERDGAETLNVVVSSSTHSSTANPGIFNIEYLAEEVLPAGVDSKSPTVTGIENNATYYVTQNATVKDIYLDSVTLNGQDITQKDIIPGGEESVALSFDKDSYNYQMIVPGMARGALGVVSGSGDTHRIYVRPEGVNGSGAIKYSSSPASTSVMLGKANVAADGTSAAYVLEPNTTYSVSFYFYNQTNGITINLMGTNSYQAVSGCVLYSNTINTTSGFVEYSTTFTTPDYDTLGNNRYLCFVITKPDSISAYTALLDDVTITKQIPETYIVHKTQNLSIRGNVERDYTLVATDTSGLTTTVNFSTKPISSIDQNLASITEENVAPENRSDILAAKEICESIDLTYATYYERSELDALILKYNKLLLKLDGKECEAHIYSNDCDATCNNCGEVRAQVEHAYTDDDDNDCNNCGFVRRLSDENNTIGVFASSLRKEGKTDEKYTSAGIRFRGRIPEEYSEKATEIGFILVPSGYSADSEIAIKGVNKNEERNLIYSTEKTGYVDYQVFLTGLTKENLKVNLCDINIDVYMYCVVDGQTIYCGEKYTDSYTSILRRLNGVNDDESFIDSDKWWDLSK